MTKQLFKTAALALALLAGTAQADPVLLSQTHNYGTGLSTGGASGGCLTASSVKVYDATQGCAPRFYDPFNLAAIGGATVSSLQLTLTFSATNDKYLGIFAEDWKVRPASSGGNLSNDINAFDLTSSGGVYTQLFTFTAANLDVFGDIISSKNFGLAFADQAAGANNFNLFSAKLDVLGTAAVPEPSVLALAGIALFGLGLSRRRTKR